MSTVPSGLGADWANAFGAEQAAAQTMATPTRRRREAKATSRLQKRGWNDGWGDIALKRGRAASLFGLWRQKPPIDLALER